MASPTATFVRWMHVVAQILHADLLNEATLHMQLGHGLHRHHPLQFIEQKVYSAVGETHGVVTPLPFSWNVEQCNSSSRQYPPAGKYVGLLHWNCMPYDPEQGKFASSKETRSPLKGHEQSWAWERATRAAWGFVAIWYHGVAARENMCMRADAPGASRIAQQPGARAVAPVCTGVVMPTAAMMRAFDPLWCQVKRDGRIQPMSCAP